ncbi:MAG: flagellar biosynthesis protein FlhF [Bacillota bacterium]
MKVRKYQANTLAEAMALVKREMGQEAIILQTKRVKPGGLMGLFTQGVVEVTAAIDDEIETRPVAPVATARVGKAPAPPKAKSTRGTRSSSAGGRKKRPAPEAVPTAPAELEAAPAVVGSLAVAEHDPAREASALETELAKMKDILATMLRQMEPPTTAQDLPERVKALHDTLLAQDVNPRLAHEVALRLSQPGLTGPAGDLQSQLAEGIREMTGEPRPVDFRGGRRVVAFLGPTGVGKTTTIAKLAANFSLLERKNVALITCDTYRIAAVEQLKTYGQIIGVPVEVVFSPQELKEAILRHAKRDVILIDTAGRSHRNVMQMSELKGFLQAARPDETFLVLSATTKYRDAMDIVKNYGFAGFDRLLFTKLDETSTYGIILNLAAATQKGLSYFTTGQSVPEDIELADLPKLARLLTRGSDNG